MKTKRQKLYSNKLQSNIFNDETNKTVCAKSINFGFS